VKKRKDWIQEVSQRKKNLVGNSWGLKKEYMYKKTSYLPKKKVVENIFLCGKEV